MADTDTDPHAGWYDQVSAYRTRTGADRAEVYVYLLSLIEQLHPGMVPEAVSEMNKRYPEGL
jgi:hypothetical protein